MLADEHNPGSITVWGAKLHQVGEPYWDGDVIKWNDTGHPHQYRYLVSLYKNGSILTSVEVDPGVEEYDFGSAMDGAKPGHFTATVQALADEDGTDFVSGDPSAASAVKTVSDQLDQAGKPWWGSDANYWTIYWNPVDHAEGYKVYLWRGETYIDSYTAGDVSSYSLAAHTGDTGTYYVEIQALGDSVLWTDGPNSPRSDGQLRIGPLPDVTDLEWHATEAGVITWAAVDHASGYHVRLHDSTDDEVVFEDDAVPATATSYALLQKMRDEGAGSYYASIKAKGDGISFMDSANWVNTSAKEIIQLAAPTNLAISDAGVGSWENVANNNGYAVELYHDGQYYAGGSTGKSINSYNFASIIRGKGPGGYHFKVKAKGTGYYLESGWAESGTLTVQRLAVPSTVTLANGQVSWSTVENAHHYQLLLLYLAEGGGPAIEVFQTDVPGGTTSYDLLSKMREAAGYYCVTVKTMGDPDSVLYLDSSSVQQSDWETVQALPAPTGLSWDGETLKWNNIAGATGAAVASYSVQLRLGGADVGDPVNAADGTTGVDFSSQMTTLGGVYTATVTAVAKTDSLYLDSEAATSPEYTKYVTLDTPVNLVFSDAGVGTWDNVPNNSGYSLELYRDDVNVGYYSLSADETSEDFSYRIRNQLGEGVYLFKVKALGTGYYLDSDWAESGTITVQRLGQPTNRTLINGQASWDTVANAHHYHLRLHHQAEGSSTYEVVYTTDVPGGTTSYDLLSKLREAAGSYQFSVRAMGDPGSVLYLDSATSAFSLPETVQGLPDLTGLTWDGETLKWTNLTGDAGNAVDYYRVQLRLGGADVGDPVNAADGTTGVDFSASMAAGGAGYYTATVTAIAKTDSLYLDSSAETSPQYTKTGPLGKVAQPSLSDTGVVTWEDVAIATYYQVRLYDSSNNEIASTTVAAGVESYNLLEMMRNAGAGTYYATVQALGTGLELYTDGPESDPSNTQTVAVLADPVVTLNDQGVASWSSANATEYTVSLYRDGVLVSGTAETTADTGRNYLSLMRQAAGVYTVKVIAQAPNTLYLDSGEVTSASQEVIKLAQAAKPALSTMGVATWDAVPDAVSYKLELYKNGSLLKTVEGATSPCNLLADIRAGGEGSYTVRVTALGNEYLILDGAPSTASDPQTVEKLAQVGRPEWDDAGIISWTVVEGASQYLVKLYRGDEFVSEHTVNAGPDPVQTYDVPLLDPTPAGFFNVTVQALGAGMKLDGEPSLNSRYLVSPLQDGGVWEADGMLQLLRKLYLCFTGNTSFEGLLDAQFSTGHTTGAPAGKKAAGLFLTLDYEDLEGSSENFSALIRIYLESGDIAGLKKGTLRLYRLENGTWVPLPQSGISFDTQGDYVWAEVDGFSEFGVFGDPAPADGDGDGKEKLPKTWGLLTCTLFAGLLIAAAGILLRRLRFSRS